MNEKIPERKKPPETSSDDSDVEDRAALDKPQKNIEKSDEDVVHVSKHSRRLQEKGADLHRLRQYVERWVIWLHGGLQGAVRDNRFSQIWTYQNEKLLHKP